MKLIIHKCVCNVIAVPNPTQYTKFDKYMVKCNNRDWSDIGPKCGFRVCVASRSQGLGIAIAPCVSHNPSF